MRRLLLPSIVFAAMAMASVALPNQAFAAGHLCGPNNPINGINDGDDVTISMYPTTATTCNVMGAITSGGSITVDFVGDGTPATLTVDGPVQAATGININTDGMPLGISGSAMSTSGGVSLAGSSITVDDVTASAGGITLSGGDVSITGNLTATNSGLGITGTTFSLTGSITAPSSLYIQLSGGPLNLSAPISTGAVEGIFISDPGYAVTTDVLTDTGTKGIQITGKTVTTKALSSKGPVTVQSNGNAGNVKVAGAITSGTDQIILVQGSNITVTGKITAPATMVLSTGPNVTVTGSGTVTLADVTSSAVAADQPGGSVQISGGTVKVGGHSLNANGLGNGAGGNIQLISSANIDLTAANTTIHTVAGTAGTGVGGTVGVSTSLGVAPDPINVNAIIKVDGGSMLAVGGQDGSISINSVNCGQIKTNYAYPKTYWDCGGGKGSGIASAAHSLPTKITALLAKTQSAINPSVQVYSMTINDNWYSYFGLPNMHVVGGYGISRTSVRASAAFTNVYNNAGKIVTAAAYSGSSTITKGSIIHELAHQLDYIWGVISATQAWTGLQTPDYAYMDNKSCSLVFVAASNYCTNNPGKTNSAIFLYEYPAFDDSTYPQNDPNGGDAELFAAKFENVQRGAGPAYPYSVDPYLEQPLSFLPSMGSYIAGLVKNPPPTVN